MRIIFVEDNGYLRETMAEMLEGSDREIVACETAEEALAQFERRPADVVITDVSLPGMSGIDLARRVIERVPGTWVIVSSGYAFDRGLESLGPTVRSLPKPFEIDAMDALLDEIRRARGG
ncbi:MAG: response regulator [Proteobacteria bacterium]|nr:response regulator [Pseudomonadota bacterium]